MLNSRSHPGDPPKPGPPPPGLPGPGPPDRPKILEKPLYPNTKLRMELSVVLPMYGRADAGQNATAATHHPADTNNAAPPASNCPMRRPNFGGPAHR